MRFLLSIHDVWPGNRQLVTGYLARLRSLGAENIALLVVPAYHGQTTFDKNLEFVDWLRKESAKGTELFLHGYHHKIPEVIPGQSLLGRRSAWGKWVNRTLVGQEAEFCGLGHSDQTRLLEMGLESWSQTGLPMSGFVVPTWHGSPSMEVLRERHFEAIESRFFITRLQNEKSVFAPPLAWSFSASKNKVKLVGGEFWLRLMLRMALIKVVLHPADFASPEIETVLKRVFAKGTAIKYADLFINDETPRPTDLAGR